VKIGERPTTFTEGKRSSREKGKCFFFYYFKEGKKKEGEGKEKVTGTVTAVMERKGQRGGLRNEKKNSFLYRGKKEKLWLAGVKGKGGGPTTGKWRCSSSPGKWGRRGGRAFRSVLKGGDRTPGKGSTLLISGERGKSAIANSLSAQEEKGRSWPSLQKKKKSPLRFHGKGERREGTLCFSLALLTTETFRRGGLLPTREGRKKEDFARSPTEEKMYLNARTKYLEKKDTGSFSSLERKNLLPKRE